MAEPVLTSWRCAGCGAETRQPWGCPNRTDDDDVDHVLRRRLIIDRVTFHDDPSELNPFVRFRALSQSYQLATIAGLSDQQFVDLTGDLDAAVAAVDGAGFAVTPITRLGGDRGLWLKHDWRSVSGSHKARHLMGIAVYLRVGEAIGARRETPRLAIASCGNAALAAAVLARAMDAPLQVFIPIDAKPSVVARLRELRAEITVCERSANGPPGDPTYHAFQAAVRRGALPFCVQGPDCGLTIEGGRTLGWEIAAALTDTPKGQRPTQLAIQIGGGAMATAVTAGLADFVALGLLDRVPALHPIQTVGCAPLVRAWRRLDGAARDSSVQEALERAVTARSAHMWPWGEEPESLAHGILDDETYDWYAVVEATARTGGHPILVDDGMLVQARSIASAAAQTPISYTGAAGLAGALTLGEAAQDQTLVVLSGRDRET